MSLTITGNKYTGTITSVGTSSLQDTTKGFTGTDFSQTKPRMVWIFKSGNPAGFARTASASGNLITLDAPFVDIDGNEVAQVIGDTYYVSLIFSERTGAGLSVTRSEVTCTDQIIFGTAGDNASIFIHSEGQNISTNVAGTSSSAPFQVSGGCVTFGNPLSVADRLTTSGCVFYFSTTSAGHGVCIKNSAASALHFGTRFIFEDGNTGRMPGGAGAGGFSNAYWQMYLNCTTNGNIVTPGGGANWSARADFQRLINLNSAGGGNNLINSRWADGFFEGGQFKNSGAGLAPFGSDSVGTFEVAATAGKRLSIFDTAKQKVWRSNTAVNQTINFTNVLVADADKSAMFGVTATTNNNATLYFKFKERYSGLIVGTKVYIKDTNDALAYSETIDASGVSQDISLTYEMIDLPSAPVRYNPWTVGIFKYGLSIISINADVSDVVLGSNTVKDLSFGGPIAQGADLLITEPSKAVVDAYTEIENAAKFYDRSAAFLEDNYTAESQTIVSRNGSLIDAGSFNVVIDATAVAAFAFDGTTITIKASIFTGDMITTGTITLANGSQFSGTRTDTNGTVSPPGVSTFNGIVFGSRLYVEATATVGSITAGDVLYNEIVNTDPVTFLTVIQGSQPILYRIRKASSAPFYKEVAGTGTITSNGFEVNVSQDLD